MKGLVFAAALAAILSSQAPAQPSGCIGANCSHLQPAPMKQWCPASPHDGAFEAPEFIGIGDEPKWPKRPEGVFRVVSRTGTTQASVQGRARCRWFASYMTRHNKMERRCFPGSVAPMTWSCAD